LKIIGKYGLPAVVAINAFPTDSAAEHALVREAALKAGASDAVVSSNWAKGGDGAAKLAEAVDKACAVPAKANFLYPLELSIKEKIETIAREVYGAGSVTYTDVASAAIDKFSSLGYDKLPICMAKTHLSLSHDPTVKARPRALSSRSRTCGWPPGAGFIYPLTGEISTMPGCLPCQPIWAWISIPRPGLSRDCLDR
jgi:formyltetrahydrofolate synthetase